MPDKLKNSDDSNEGNPQDLSNILEMFISQQEFSGQLPNPLLSKINEKHIDKILELSKADSELEYKDNHNSRKFRLIYFVLLLLFSGTLIFILADKDNDLLMKILESTYLFLGGLAGGYGLKSYTDKKSKL